MDFSNIGDTLINDIGEQAGSKSKTFIEYITSSHFYFSLIVVAVTVGLWVLLIRISKYYNKKISQDNLGAQASSQRKTIAHVMTSVLKAVLLLGAIIAILQVNGFNVTTLVTSVGVLTAVIGFAFQDAIKDVICGLYILADHYFVVGDVVRYNGIEGEVIRMSIRSTKIKDIDKDNIVTISNRQFSEATKVSNWMDIDLGLSYEENVAEIHKLLTSVAAQISTIDGIINCEYKGTNDFAESAVIYKLRVYCDPKNKPVMRRAALRVIQDRLWAAGIQIPYRYLNVVNIDKTTDKNLDSNS